MKVNFLLFIILNSSIVFTQTSDLTTDEQTKRVKNSLRLAQQHKVKYENDVEKLKVFAKEKNIELTPDLLSRFTGYSQGIPMFVDEFNDGVASTSNVDLARTATINGEVLNLTGKNQTLYLWETSLVGTAGKMDANKQPTEYHQDFGNRVSIGLSQNTVGITSNHATQVSGVALGAGTGDITKKGMAPQANLFSFDLDKADSEFYGAVSAIVSNHSYGVTTGWGTPSSGKRIFRGNYASNNQQSNWSGQYDDSSFLYDDVIYKNPNHLMVKAAGNGLDSEPLVTEKNINAGKYTNLEHGISISSTPFLETDVLPLKNCANGYDCLPLDGGSKNTLIVGGVQKITGRYAANNQVIQAKWSSVSQGLAGSVAGPRDDGAIKPDVVAVGLGVTSTSNTSNTAYSTNLRGTSFAAPAVSGIALLLHELWENKGYGTLRSDVIKGIITHNTNEAGNNPGPDAVFGWGLVDALKSVTCIMNRDKTSIIDTYTLNNSQTITKTYKADGSVPFKVSVVWVDPPGIPDNRDTTNNNRTPKLVNDVDVVVERVSDNSQTFPWKLDALNPSVAATKGVNNVDNIEQIVVENPTVAAEYRIKITHKGTLKDNKQDFALVITGVKDNMSIEETNKTLTDRIELSPNPAKNFMLLKLPQEIKNTGLAIYDLNGRLIKTLDALDFEAGIVDIQELSPNQYLLKIETNQGIVNKKFIKE